MDILRKRWYRGVGEEKRWMNGEKGRVGICLAKGQTTKTEKNGKTRCAFSYSQLRKLWGGEGDMQAAQTGFKTPRKLHF